MGLVDIAKKVPRRAMGIEKPAAAIYLKKRIDVTGSQVLRS